MAIYYKVDVRSEYHDLNDRNTRIIIKKGFWFAKEIVTNVKLMICDNKLQGSCYDYYVMSSDLVDENIASLNDVKEYSDPFTYDVSPVYSKKEERETKKLIREKRKR